MPIIKTPQVNARTGAREEEDENNKDIRRRVILL